MASASTTSSNAAARKPAKKKSSSTASKLRAEKMSRAASKPRQLFIPGSLNDQLSKLGPNDSFARCLRIPLDDGSLSTINDEAQKFFKAQNSILSGGIAKVRGSTDHKHKRFKMERGNYMSASNDAMFAFVTVTRME